MRNKRTHREGLENSKENRNWKTFPSNIKYDADNNTNHKSINIPNASFFSWFVCRLWFLMRYRETVCKLLIMFYLLFYYVLIITHNNASYSQNDVGIVRRVFIYYLYWFFFFSHSIFFASIFSLFIYLSLLHFMACFFYFDPCRIHLIQERNKNDKLKQQCGNRNII